MARVARLSAERGTVEVVALAGARAELCLLAGVRPGEAGLDEALGAGVLRVQGDA